MLVEAGIFKCQDIQSVVEDLLEEYGVNFFHGSKYFDKYLEMLALDKSIKDPKKEMKALFKQQMNLILVNLEDVLKAGQLLDSSDTEYQKELSSRFQQRYTRVTLA